MADHPLVKKLKTSHHDTDEQIADQFATGVLDHTNIQKLHTAYSTSKPFKYAIVEQLFRDELLRKVKDECLNELSFTEKETDIYKVNQTGDLASLSYLASAELSLLPNLLALRDALYSPSFRAFLRAVTGCGALSGTKQDMSVNSYRKGCHLLNHDDVIGTRRVSYILYMPLPHDQLWQRDWGGALELYPVKLGAGAVLEPEAVPVQSIAPSWNQFVFFEVQPGRSFHSVEEVVVGGDGDGRERLSISGWFHAAQEHEEGYVPEPDMSGKSSRDQLTSTATEFTPYPSTDGPPLPDTPLSDAHTAFLSEFLNQVYLEPRTLRTLAARFVEESSLELHSFLCAPLASILQAGLRKTDAQDRLDRQRAGRMPPHDSGTTDSTWTVKGPPHKWRYCVLQPRQAAPHPDGQTPGEVLRKLQEELFPSAAFRAWMAVVSSMVPLRYAVEARRFRPGLDYTLATSEEGEARLDVVLGLTPGVEGMGGVADGGVGRQGVAAEPDQASRGWEAGEWGGWECYMAPHDEEDDPAVYRSSGSHKKATNGTSTNEGASKLERMNEDGDQDEEEAGEEDEDDSTLLTVQPGFNRLLLVLRDERVMRFVKYVSATAEGSRWDVCGEYEIGMIEEDDGSDS